MNLTAAGILLCSSLFGGITPTVNECETELADIALIGTKQYRTTSFMVISVGDPPVPEPFECVTFAKDRDDIRQSICWKPGQWTLDVHKGHWKRR